MSGLTAFSVGVAALGLGLVLLLMARLAAAWAARRRPPLDMPPAVPAPASPEPAADALILAQPGGRILFVNPTAREWFGMNGGPPNLEAMARRALPSDSFYRLFAAEGTAHIRLSGRDVRASSHALPVEPGSPPRMVVMLREAALVTEMPGGSGRAAEAVPGALDLSLAHAGLDLHATLSTVLNAVQRLLPFDRALIRLWDEERQQLFPGADLDTGLIAEPGARPAGNGANITSSASDRVARERRPVLVLSAREPTDAPPAPFRSYAGVPLLAHDKLVGTLELLALSDAAFEDQTVLALQALAGEAGPAIRNARLYAAERERAAELSGLTGIWQAAGALSDSRELSRSLTAEIASRMEAEFLGFLLEDEGEAVLMAQAPFHGVPDPVIEMYRIPLGEGESAGAFWRGAEAFFFNDVLGDPRAVELGLTPFAQAAGIRNTLLAPLTAHGRRLGWVQAGNKKADSGFDDSDARRLALLAGQAALVIDNARLLAETRERDARSEGLRRITDVLASSLDLDEILTRAVAELAALLGAERAAVLLLDEARGELHPHMPSVFGGGSRAEQRLATLPPDDPTFRFSVSQTRQPFLTNRAQDDPRVLLLYRPMVDYFQLRSLIDVPLVARDRGLGEVVLGKNAGRPFGRADLELALTVAGQLAGAVERARLASATDADLRRRVEQLTALTHVGRELNRTLELERVLRLVLDEAIRVTRADEGGLLLFDFDSPDTPFKPVLRLGEAARVEGLLPPESEAMLNGVPSRIPDLVAAGLAPPVPDVRAAMGIPITYQGTSVGFIRLFAAEPDAFDAAAEEIALALAAQATIAVGNSLRFNEQVRRADLLRRRADALAQLFQVSRSVRSDRPLDANLETIAFGVQEATGYNVVLMSVVDPESHNLRPVAGVGLPLTRLEVLRTRSVPWATVEALFEGGETALPADRLPERLRAVDGEVLSQGILFMALKGSGGHAVGLMAVDEPRAESAGAPDRLTVETLEIFANQGALAIENARLLDSYQSRAAELTQSLSSLEASYRALDESSAALVEKDRLLGRAVDDLDRRNRQLLAIHRIVESLAEERDAESIFDQFAVLTVREFGATACVVVTSDSGRLRLRAAACAVAADAQLEVLLGPRNPLRQVAATRTAIVEPDVAGGAWSESPLIHALEVNGFACLPLEAGERFSGAVLIGTADAAFALQAGDQDLLAVLMAQLGIGLERAALFNETERRLSEVNLLLDFSRQIAGQETDGVAQSLTDTALRVVEHADASIYFTLDRDGRALRAATACGVNHPAALAAMRLPAEAKDSIPARGFASLEPIRWHRVDAARDLNMSPENLALFHKATDGRIPASAMAIPLTASDRQLGVLVLMNFALPAVFTDSDQALAASLASQAAVAIHNALLYRQTLELTSFNEAVFQSIQQGIVVLDTEGRVLQVNDFIRAAYDWDETIIGKNIFEQRPVFREIGLDSGFRAILETGRPMDRQRVTHLDRTGRNLVRNFYGYPLRHSGKIAGVVVLLEDITERAKLEEDVRERAAALEALTQASRAITASLRREDILASLLAELKRILPYQSATLWLREGIRLRIVAAQGYENDLERIGLQVEIADSALFSEMVAARGAVSVPDVRDNPRFPMAGELPYRSWLGIPLIVQNEVLGVFAIEAAPVDDFRPQHVQVAEAFAGQAAVALENARLFEESLQRAAELDTRSQRLALLNRMSAALSSTLQVERILQMTLAELAGALQVEQAGAILFDEPAGVGRLLAEVPAGRAEMEVTIPLAGNPIVERVRATLAPLEVEDVAGDELTAPVRDTLLARAVQSILIVPLVVGGRVVGTLGLDALRARRHFTAGEVELAQTFANQAAVAIQNAQLYNETQLRLIELATINQISRAISSAIDTRQVLDVLQLQISAVLSTENFYLARFDAEAGMVWFPLVVERGEELTVPPGPPAGLTGLILNARTSLLLTGDEASERMAELGAQQVGEGVARSYLGVPLLLGDQITGVLAVQDYDRTNAYNEGHERVLSTIAAQLAVALENARLYEETQALTRDLERRVAERTVDLEHERDRVEALLRITSELSTSLDLDRVLARTLAMVGEAAAADQAGIYLIDPQSDRLIHRAALGRPTPLPPGGEALPFNREQGLAGWVIQNRASALVGDLQNDARWINLHEDHRAYRSALAVPLVASEDALGALLLLSKRPDAFDDDLMKLVTAAAAQVAAAINNAELYRLIRDQAERLGAMLRGQQVEASKSRAILEAVADGVLVADAAGAVTLFNAAAERILRLPRAEVLGRPVSELVGIYGAASRAWSDAISRWATDPESYRPGDFLAERITLDDARVVSVHLAPVTTPSDFLGSVSVFRDITREVEVDRLKSEFVATVSHELRTPMTSIKGYADLMLMGAAGALPPDQARFLEVIRNNADRLSILVNDLLDISRIESGKVSLNVEEVDLVEIARAVIEHLHDRIRDENKPMEVLAEFGPDVPDIMGDRGRVRQILTNLADNAFLYTPAGGRITIRLSSMPGGVQVDVVDNGIGIPEDEQNRIFDRFYRGEDPLVLASAGTGLGLSIVRHLVEMHHGYIWVQSDGVRGRGSTFSFLLPLTHDMPTAEPIMG